MSSVQSRSMREVSTDEIGPYRSLHTMAVLSFVLGLLSLLSFAPFWLFVWIFPAAAILTGVLSLRRIVEAPEVWSGTKLAQAGIGLGLACVVGAGSLNFYTKAQIKSYGRAAADRFMEKLKAGELEAAFWLTIPRDARANMAKLAIDALPDELLEHYASFRMELSEPAKRLANGEATCEFDSVEEAFVDRGSEYAAVVYKYHSQAEDTHILVIASSQPSMETNEKAWFIRERKWGYDPHSYEAPQAPAGHGHSH